MNDGHPATPDANDHQVPASPASGSPASHIVEGERRVITILFCDVVGSTSLAGQLDPEEWAEVMNEAFQYMIAPIQEYGGMVARLMGDAVLAFFGAPVAHEDDPQRAVLAALGIINGMRPFMRQFHADYGLEFDVRVGINTGPVVVGEIGSDRLQEYTAMGDAINLAARMEQTALPGTVQISADTYRLVAPYFDTYDLGPIEVKGKDEPVLAYRVLDMLPVVGRLRGIDGLETHLVGRDPEVGRLSDGLANVTNAGNHIAFVLGEAGLGKSRLIAELRREWFAGLSRFYADDIPAWHAWAEFVAVSYGTSRPYDMIKRQLRKYYSIRETDPPAVVREHLSALTNPFPEPVRGQMLRYFGFLLGDTQPPGGPLPEGESFKRELRAVLTDSAVYLTDIGPLVYVIDDLHWADPASIEALRGLLPLAAQRPIFFLMALRPDVNTPGWQFFTSVQQEFADQCVSIYLEPLSRDDGRALITQLLGKGVPAAVVEAVQQKAEGNPLFIEEVVRALYDSGLVERTANGPEWRPQAAELDALKLIGLPGNVQSLMTARIDRLAAPERRTLQLAAVIGRTFPAKVLEQLVGRDVDLAAHLQSLVAADLIRPTEDVAGEYRFMHALARDAAYETILMRQRRRYHRQVAEAMETTFAGSLAEEAPRLAAHYVEARDWARAIRYCMLAGEAAAKIYAHAEAIEHFGLAIELARANPTALTNERLGELYLRRGRVFELESRYDEALAQYEALEALGIELADDALELAAVNAQTIIYSTPNSRMDAGRGLVLANRALDLAHKTGDTTALARAHWSLLLYYLNAAIDPILAVENGEMALALTQGTDNADLRGFVLNDIGRAYAISGRIDDAMAAFRAARENWIAVGNEPMLTDALGLLAQGLLMTGHPAEAAGYSREGIAVAHRISSNWAIAFNGIGLASALLELGQISPAIELLRQTAELAQLAHFQGASTVAAVSLAWTYGQLGAPEAMHDEIAQWIDSTPRAAATAIIGASWKAVELYNAGRIAEAVEVIHGNPFLSIVADGNDSLLSALPALDILIAAEDFDGALTLVDQLISMMRDYGIEVYLADLLRFRAAALRGLGQSDEALESLRQSYRVAKGQGVHGNLWQTLAGLVATETDAAERDRFRAEAQQEIAFLSDNIDDMALREAFLALPRVAALQAQP